MAKAKPIYAALPVRAISDPRLKERHFRALAAVAAHDRLGANGIGCYASQDRLAEMAISDYTRLSTTLKDLGEWGYLERKPHPLNKRLRVYQVLYTDEDGAIMSKTIIFAKSIAHANFIVERFDANFPALAGHFCRSIAHQDSYAQSLIDDFSTSGKAPHIAVSVDMLDTGIDVPEVVNLVFFKVVRSKTKFWQMIGRGTRLCPDLFGPGQHKAFFSVFDWCRNFEFFNTNPAAVDGTIGEPLGKRLFTARVELVGELDRGRESDGGELSQPPTPILVAGEMGSAPDEAARVGEVRDTTAGALRAEVAGMSLDNFLVRPKRRYVEKYAARPAWELLGPDAQHELVEHVAGLPSAVIDDDLAAKQFDLVVLRAQLALLRVESILSHRQRITELAALLEQVSNVPMVAAELALVLEVQTDEFWQDVTLPMLETVRRRLRGLIKLIDVKRRPFVFIDIEDKAGAETEMMVAGISIGTDFDAFRRKARQFLKPHENRLAIQKLRRGDALTPTDLDELERIFVEAGVGSDDLDTVRQNGGIGRFVRSLVGLDRSAVQRRFDAFRSGRPLTASQIQFIDMIIEHLTARGAMEPGRLYESPFTDFNSAGVDGVFDQSTTAELIDILESIDRTAA